MTSFQLRKFYLYGKIAPLWPVQPVVGFRFAGFFDKTVRDTAPPPHQNLDNLDRT
jgi:hypothetical protein